jgi:hypothetical protein
MQIPTYLIDEIRKGNCALFVGAGLSAQSGLPTWAELMTPLARELGVSEKTDYTHVAQYYENQMGRQRLVTRIMETLRKSAAPSRAHELIASLPFQVIFTTNYDSLLECALSDAQKQYTVIVSDAGATYWSADRVQIVKMHGGLDDPTSLVVTADDYATYFRRHPLIADLLKTQLTTKTFLFLGYSLSDPDFQMIFDGMRFDAERHRRVSFCVTSHADRFAIDDWKRKGIEIILSDAFLFLEQLQKEFVLPTEPRAKDILDSLQQQYPVRKDLCFVLMPFRQELDQLYQDVIKPAVESQGLRCVRSDEIYSVRPIMEDIWEHIQQSNIIIAELTGRNPNVFYELGLSHAIKRKTILITQTMDDVPFDLRHYRCIVYSNTYRGAKDLEDKLISTIKAVK